MEEKKPENVVLSGNLSKRNAGTLVSEHEMWERHQRFISAATSENTRRTYRSAIRHFYAWGGALPCDSGAVLRYLLAYSDSLNPRTLALRLTALAQWHAFQGFPDPTADPSVRKTLKGITRTHGKPKKKAKALPIEDLEAIVAKLEPDISLIAIRNNALLQIGFFGALRRSELAALMVEELAWETDGLVITLARSKTDQEGEGVSKAIPYGGPDGICCPVRALKRWVEAANIISGAVFRRVTRWGAIGTDPLSDGSINNILEACAKAVDLAYVPELSSHSLRRGLATSAHRSGADFKDIKRQGGWRHDGTVQGYIEEAGRFEANAALTLLRRKGKNEASKP
ncbi:MAG TPA: tyrosine-type recombinase/integrase [Nitrosospira sp.]|nr:tyrosine-type recombinase/integrase [Nitrosospira sp.]